MTPKARIRFLITSWRGSVPNGSLKWSSSCLVWSLWLFQQFEGTLFRVNADERISEFTHFKLVIRLSKVKQSVFRFCTTFAILLDLPSLRSEFSALPESDWRNRQTPSYFATETRMNLSSLICTWFQASGMSSSLTSGRLGRLRLGSRRLKGSRLLRSVARSRGCCCSSGRMLIRAIGWLILWLVLHGLKFGFF